jgi:hypothetical protein
LRRGQVDSIFLANAWQTAPGNYIDNLVASNGCDSILTSTLTIKPTKTNTVQLSICQGDSVFAGGMWQTMTGTYVDVLSTTQQCDSIVTIQLTVNAADISVSRTGNTLTANASSASYQWLDCGTNNIISGETNQIYVPAVNGNYAAIITQNNCTDTSDCYEISTVGIEQYSDSKINIYPNPSKSVVTIELGEEYEKVDLILRNNLGQVVLNDSFKNIDKTTINLIGLSKGSYFLEVTTEKGSASINLIKN